MAEEIEKILSDENMLKECVDFVFKDADQDGSETIEKDELCKHMKMVYDEANLGEVDENMVNQWMEEFDTNKDGVLDRGEFKEYVVKMLKMDLASKK